ncbi:MAG: Gfo/Idh/MocA family oxidoreductase, partial [Candidatus Omnitrophica bacterium]|nr:Gfo/Idh/MocA family oxidoreductase [Candidatus Omnitrophota bacterium]
MMNRVVIFGLGSIGLRHAGILSKRKDIEMYAFRSHSSGKKNSLGIPEITTWNEVKKLQPQIALISNPTHLHLKTAMKCAESGMDLFIEKPLDCSLKHLSRFKKILGQ